MRLTIYNLTNKHFAIVGFLAPILFVVAYFILSSLHPEYSFLYKAISELGSMDAPYKWIWNIFGYALPGLFIAWLSLGLHRAFAGLHISSFPFMMLALSGLFMTAAGIFPGDFDNKQSSTMILHTIGSFGSYLFFLLAAFTFPKQLRNLSYWKDVIPITLAFTWLSILLGSWPFLFPQIPAVGQRFVFGFYFLWITVIASRLYNAPSNKR